MIDVKSAIALSVICLFIAILLGGLLWLNHPLHKPKLDKINEILNKPLFGDPTSYQPMFIDPVTKPEKVEAVIRDIVSRGADPEDFRIDFVGDQAIATPKDMEINWEDKGKGFISLITPDEERIRMGLNPAVPLHILMGTQSGTIEGYESSSLRPVEVESFGQIGTEKRFYLEKHSGEVVPEPPSRNTGNYEWNGGEMGIKRGISDTQIRLSRMWQTL